MMMNIEKKLVEILAVILGVDEEMITSDAQVTDDLGAESIDFVDLTYQLEKNFDIDKVEITDIYPEAMYGEFSEENLKSMVEENPYLEKNLMKIMMEQKNYSIIGSVYAIQEFIQWKIGNAE